MSENKTRRSGGRAARQAMRAAPLADNVRPIRAGMEGGTYKPLSDHSVQRIHETALKALETIGMADAPKSGIDVLVKAGAVLGDDGRLRFPRSVIEDALAMAAKKITLFSRDGKNDLELYGNRVHYG
ncbi:MAG: trimethylamine methyltransferase family protein, partial [Amylibacter sp.]